MSAAAKVGVEFIVCLVILKAWAKDEFVRR